VKPLLPKVKNISSNLLGDDIIGMKPYEKWNDAIKRFILEKRVKKINKIIKKGSD
jgi:hypothetical protein